MNKLSTYHIQEIHSDNFEQYALDIFQYQEIHCKVYRDYCQLLGITAKQVKKLTDIPFLPVGFFKTHRIGDSDTTPDVIFESSGTTGHTPARHFVHDIQLYEQSFLHSFKQFYGSPENYIFLALLPSYLERQHSSLVYMTEKLMKKSRYPGNGFFLHDFDQLKHVLIKNEKEGLPTFFLGVSYALLDFSEAHPMPLKNTIVMETGGMKGKRPEIARMELHRILKDKFHVKKIHSEYGMTELLSQAYSNGEGIFHTPPQMKILIREEDDPLNCHHHVNLKDSISGPVNIIDLANIHSCSFIATEDMGRLHPDGSFEIIGRIQDSATRGCGLMYES